MSLYTGIFNNYGSIFFLGCTHRYFSGFKLLYRLGVISVNKFLMIKNQESLHADPCLGKRFFSDNISFDIDYRYEVPIKYTNYIR